MSLEATCWAWKNCHGTSTELVVFLALIERSASGDGVSGRASSHEAVAKLARLNVTAVTRALAGLSDLGDLRVRANPDGSISWWIPALIQQGGSIR